MRSQAIDDGGHSSGRPRSIPPATVARLAAYEQVLSVMGRDRSATSSEELAAEAGVSPATLRKDLSYLGTHGIRGVGYDVALLTGEIGRALGAHRTHRVALVGVGNLGAALANYPGFESRGLRIGALFDVDPQRVGQRVGGVVVDHVDDIVPVCRRTGVTIGVIATPENAAQSAANALVAAGIDAILAFTPGVIQVPDGVELRKVDLAIELQILAFHVSQRTVDLVGPAPGIAAAPDLGAPDLPDLTDLPASAVGSRRLTAPLTRSVS
jgi:redox-sensing transcriptional repressor